MLLVEYLVDLCRSIECASNSVHSASLRDTSSPDQRPHFPNLELAAVNVDWKLSDNLEKINEKHGFTQLEVERGADIRHRQTGKDPSSFKA